MTDDFREREDEVLERELADEFDEYGEPYDDEDPYENDDPCAHCGPSCGEWGGDGLCMIAIREQASQGQYFEEHCIHPDTPCPVCGVQLTMYDIPADELWVWPGDFLNPLIGLSIYSAYGVPKGELHRQGDICHIWIGEPDSRDEKLIRLNGYHEPPCETQETEPASVADSDIPF